MIWGKLLNSQKLFSQSEKMVMFKQMLLRPFSKFRELVKHLKREEITKKGLAQALIDTQVF